MTAFTALIQATASIATPMPTQADEIKYLEVELDEIDRQRNAITKGRRPRSGSPEMAALAKLPDPSGLRNRLKVLYAEAAAQEKQAIEQQARQSLQALGEFPETVVIDEKTLTAVNSEGLPIAATESGLRNFWVWFGDDGEVDRNDLPQIFTHSGDKGFSGINQADGYFGGIFVLPGTGGARYRAQDYHMYLTGKIIGNDQIKRFFDCEPDAAKALVDRVLMQNCDEDTLENIQRATLDECFAESEIDLFGRMDYAESYKEMQRLRGEIARHLGGSAVKIHDEFSGDALLIIDGTKVKSATGNNGDFALASVNIMV